MDIIYILPDKNGGVKSVVSNLLKFRSGNHKTKAILLHNTKDNPSSRITEDLPCDTVIRIQYNGYWHSKYQIARKILKHLTPNSILISNDGAIELPAIKLLQFQIPIVYILHGDNQHYYRTISENIEIISGIIGVSKHAVSNVAHMAQSANIKACQINFPVPENKNQRVIDNKKIRIAFIGALSESKGVLEFEKIIQRIEALNIQYHFNIIGDGPLKELLVKTFNSNINISIKGNIINSQVLKLHTEHDILILPSKSEGLPVSIIEAMKSGVVPLASNIKSGIPELIQDGVTGYKINIGNEIEYAEQINYLCKNPDKFAEISQNCMDFANSMFEPYKQTIEYESFFLNIFENFETRHFEKKNLLIRFSEYLPCFLEFKAIKLLKRKE